MGGACLETVDNWLVLCGYRRAQSSPGASTAEEGGSSMEIDVRSQELAEGGAAQDAEGSGDAGEQAQDAVAAFLACLRVCRTCKSLATDGVAARLAKTLLSDDSVKSILSAADAGPCLMVKDVTATLLGVLPLQLALQDSLWPLADKPGQMAALWAL